MIDLVAKGGGVLTVEGNAGREYDFALFGTEVGGAVATGAAEVLAAEGGVLRVKFAGEEGERVTARVRLTPR